jgi:hypothetical protein
MVAVGLRAAEPFERQNIPQFAPCKDCGEFLTPKIEPARRTPAASSLR